jgi:hypothetical protein
VWAKFQVVQIFSQLQKLVPTKSGVYIRNYYFCVNMVILVATSPASLYFDYGIAVSPSLVALTAVFVFLKFCAHFGFLCALISHNLCTLDVGGWLTSRPGRLTPVNDSVPMVMQLSKIWLHLWDKECWIAVAVPVELLIVAGHGCCSRQHASLRSSDKIGFTAVTQVLTAVLMKIKVVWGITSCPMVSSYRRFGGT